MDDPSFGLRAEELILEPTKLLLHLFYGKSTLLCEKSADYDDNGELEFTDVIHLLNWVFLGDPFQVEPFAVCGFDPTPDLLTCEKYPPCDATE